MPKAFFNSVPITSYLMSGFQQKSQEMIREKKKMWIKRNKGDLRTRLRDNIDQRRISNNCDECVEGSRGETG